MPNEYCLLLEETNTPRTSGRATSELQISTIIAINSTPMLVIKRPAGMDLGPEMVLAVA